MSTIKSSDEHLTLNADGSGNDIKFQSNGSEVASISDAGKITATNFAANADDLEIQSSTGEKMIKCVKDAQVNLYYDNSKKLATSSTGITLTGTAGTSPILELNNADTEDNDTGRESSLRYTGKRSGGEDVINAQISGHHDGSADDDKGMMLFYTNNGSGLSQQLKITNDGRGLSQFTAQSWVRVDMDGGHSTIDSHNISSISDGGTGVCTVNIATDPANSNYCVATAPYNTSAGSESISSIGTGTFTIKLQLVTSSSISYYDRGVMAVVFGD